MEVIRDAIEWAATETVSVTATLFPYILIGLLGLWVLWVVIGYLRVSQIGLGEGRDQQVVALPGPTEAGDESRPRGLPYCAVDNLQFPLGARFCTQCERDLILDCVNCGATLGGGDASCYRCGTPTGADTAPQL